LYQTGTVFKKILFLNVSLYDILEYLHDDLYHQYENVSGNCMKALKTAGIIIACTTVVLLASPTPPSLIAGGIAVAIGELIRLWATGHLTRNQEVTTSGPYAYVRDPLYLGRLFLITGFCIMAWGYALLLLPVGLAVFFLNYMPRKYRKEMRRLENLFGETYTHYAAYTRSLVPGLKPYPRASTRRWSLTLCLKENREPYFILIIAAVFSGILFKYFT